MAVVEGGAVIDGLLVSSTEPPAIKLLGRSSQLPERFGADILWPHPTRGMVGVQRKTIPDLVASVQDGRLAKEVAQLQRCTLSALIVEGRPVWSTDGELTSGHAKAPRWTRNAHRSLLWSIQDKGIWVTQSDEPADTCDVVTSLHGWMSKGKHSALSRRPGPVSVWGKADHTDWARHLLSGFEGIGPELADKIMLAFDGVPLAWTVTPEEMAAVPGLGPKKVRKLFDALDA